MEHIFKMQFLLKCLYGLNECMFVYSLSLKDYFNTSLHILSKRMKIFK